MSHYFASHGASASEATRQAMAFIGQLVRTQAAILAYIDVFYVWAIATALMCPARPCARPVCRSSGIICLNRALTV
jgi:hypothetical protein